MTQKLPLLILLTILCTAIYAAPLEERYVHPTAPGMWRCVSARVQASQSEFLVTEVHCLTRREGVEWNVDGDGEISACL